MNTEAVAVMPTAADVPPAIPSPASLRQRADKALQDTGRWILIALYLFGLVFPFVGAVLALFFA